MVFFLLIIWCFYLQLNNAYCTSFCRSSILNKWLTKPLQAFKSTVGLCWWEHCFLLGYCFHHLGLEYWLISAYFERQLRLDAPASLTSQRIIRFSPWEHRGISSWTYLGAGWGLIIVLLRARERMRDLLTSPFRYVAY